MRARPPKLFPKSIHNKLTLEPTKSLQVAPTNSLITHITRAPSKDLNIALVKLPASNLG
jgi:hypothetical protein